MNNFSVNLLNSCDFSAVDVLRRAKYVLQDGGDTNPCPLGAYCLRCCIAIAKSDLDEQHGIEVPQSLYSETPSDTPLVEARNLISAKDNGIVHTKESALSVIEQILSEEQSK